MRDGWIETTIGEVSNFVNVRKIPCEQEENSIYVGLEHLESHQTSVNQVGSIEKVISSVTPFDAGDVLFGRLRPYLHKVASASFSGFCSPEILVLKANPKILPKMLLLICDSESTIETCVKMSAGTRMPRTSTSDLASIKILLPPVNQQKRIVDLISSIDSYLETLKTALARSTRARKSAIESQLEVFNQTSPVFRLEELCASGTSAIVDGPFGANLKRNDYHKQGIPVLKIQNIKQEFIVIKKMDYVSEDKFQELRRHSFQKNDIVMTKLGDPLGLSAIVKELDKGLIVADLVRIRPDKIDVEFLCTQLNSAKIQNYINRMQKGSTRPRVNLGMIREMPIVVPNENEINNFVSVFGIWSEQNRKLEAAIDSTEKFRSGLLSDLLSGDHEIPSTYDKVLGAA